MSKPKFELCHFPWHSQIPRTLVFVSSVLCIHRLLTKPTDFSGSQGVLCGCLVESLEPCSLLCLPQTRRLRVEFVARVTVTFRRLVKALGSMKEASGAYVWGSWGDGAGDSESQWACGSRGCCPGLRRDSRHRCAADRQPETKFQAPVWKGPQRDTGHECPRILAPVGRGPQVLSMDSWPRSTSPTK